MPSFKKHDGSPVPPLDDALIAKICNYLRAGAYVETAVVVAGVPKETFYFWCKIANGRIKKKRKDGREVEYTAKEREPYQRLLHAVDRAVEECQVRDLAVIDQAANGTKVAIPMRDVDGNLCKGKDGEQLYIKPMPPDWSAAAWRLERRHGKGWSRTEKLEHTGKDGGPIETSKESPEEKKARIDAKLAKLRQLIRK